MAAAAVQPCPDRIRVLTLTPFYPHLADTAGGCFIAEPISRFAMLGVDSKVIAVQPFYRECPRASSAAPSDWVRYPSLPSGMGLPSAGAFLSARLMSRVREMCRSGAVDLIHAHAALPCGHAAMVLGRKLGIPYVVTAHGKDVFFTRQVGGMAGRHCKKIAQQVYGVASRVICISRQIANELENGARSPVKISVVHNGVDAQVFRPADPAQESGTILSVGNLIPTKGHELLLRAFAAIHHKFPQTSCDIIGDGLESSRLRRMAGDLQIASRVRFLGRQSRAHVAAAMRRCAVFALPSRYEGLGCVYLEAMSAAKAVIACRGQGIAEIIEDRKNGWLIETDSLDEMVSALFALLQNSEQRRKMGAAARNTILQRFTLEHQAASLCQIYRECVA